MMTSSSILFTLTSGPPHHAHNNTNKKLITRWDSERELFYDDIVHELQNNNIYGSIAEVCYHAKILHC